VASDKPVFAGSVPEYYDRHLGPLFFRPYARDLAARVRVPAGGRLLELACGTGMLTRELAAALPPTVAIDATDLSDAMLGAARDRVPAANVRWQTADALALPFDDHVFDAVACQFGVMFFPDKVAAARQVRRVLKPGGAFWFSSWAPLAENPVSRVAHETVASFFDRDPPAFYQLPFGYADRNQIAGDLRAAGFADVTIDVVDLEAQAPTAEHAAIGLVRGTPIIAAIQERAGASAETIVTAVAAAFARDFGAAPLHGAMRAYVVHAR